MKYNYKKLTISEYIDGLYKNGLQPSTILNKEDIEKRVQNIGIFRLKGYIKAFRDGLDNYSFDDVFELYDTDRVISSKMFSLSSQVEIKLKAYLIEIVYELNDNPFFYLLKSSYTEDFSLNYESLYDWEIKEQNKSKNSEVYLHYQEYYLKHYSFDKNKQEYLISQILIIDKTKNINYPPFHYFIENLTLGSLIKILSKLQIDDKIILKLVTKRFGFYNEKVFLNYLLRLKELRNRCAHNGRLFNRNYRSIKVNGVYKEIRKNIYHHRLLDVYYSLYLLLNGTDNIKNSIDLESKFKDEVLKDRDEKIKDFIMKLLRKR